MPQAEIRNDSRGYPCHAYPRANNQFTLCNRKASLCRDCAEFGVPVIPETPFETMSRLFEEHWDKPWRERFWSVPEREEPGVLKPQCGAHIIALEGQGKEIRSIDLGWFGEDDRIMDALGAMVTIHNNRVASQPKEPAPAVCPKCHGTGYEDFASLALEPCAHCGAK